ncbi:MAG TPA: AAA family ATPase [Steroidobacteraceae bacterium]|nr:AAA family ATPase [Steroidobacteraceae bacterium]
MAPPLCVRFGAFELDEADARLKRDGRPVALPPKAFGVLCALVRQPAALITKNVLLDTVWGHQHVSESVLKTVISQIRSALEDDASRPRFVETASRLGYRFIGTVATGTEHAVPKATAQPQDSFIGREPELARLQSSWERVESGRHLLVWITGDAGIGKSTLVETFVSRSGAAVIAQGQCVEQFGTGEPYLPVLQALADLCRAYPDLIALLRSCAPAWLLQLPWLLEVTERGSLARELVGISSERMLREFQELMIRFTAQRPLLLIVEDLHWADTATLGLMDHFARQRDAGHVLWVGTFRLTQVIAEGHPLQTVRQELRLHRLCEELVLDCFTELEVQRYLQSHIMPAGASEDFVKRVHSHTDGLPLFVANVVETLRAPEQRTVTSTDLPVPEDLISAVERRIALLTSDVVALLEAAAVCGLDFKARVVASMLDRPYEEIIGTCDRLVRQQYWLRQSATLDLTDGSLDSQYVFRHAIYRHAFYRRISGAQRVSLHRRCARSLSDSEALGMVALPAELAYHHEQGHQMADAIRAYALAARSSLRSFAPGTAYEHCENARRLLSQITDIRQRHELELALESTRGAAASQLYGVASPESRAVFERVQELCELLPQHPARVALLSGYGGSLFMRAEYAKLERLAEQLDTLQRDDLLTLPFFRAIFRAIAISARGECRVATEWWMRTIAICEGITDRRAYDNFILDPEVGARANAVRTLFERGLFDRARAEAERAVNLAHQIGQPLTRSLAHWRAGMLAIRFEDPKGVLKHADAMREIVETTTVSQGDGAARYLRGWATARLGDPKGGLALIREGLERQLRIGAIANCTEVMGYAAEAMILARDWAGAEKELSKAFDRARELQEWVYSPMLMLLQARAAAGRGDSAVALHRLREAVETSRKQEAPGFELKVACTLVEHPDCTSKDRAALAALLKKLPEGHDAPDILRARALCA